MMNTANTANTNTAKANTAANTANTAKEVITMANTNTANTAKASGEKSAIIEMRTAANTAANTNTAKAAKAAAKAKTAKPRRGAAAEARIKIDNIASGLTVKAVDLKKVIDGMNAKTAAEVKRPEAKTAAAEAFKLFTSAKTAAKAKAAEALKVEAADMSSGAKIKAIKNLLAEAEAEDTNAKTAAAAIETAAELLTKEYTRGELNALIKANIEAKFAANSGKVSREAFWKAYTDVYFAVKPTKAAYILAFGEDGKQYYNDIDKAFDKFLNALFNLRAAFGKVEEFAKAEAEAFDKFREVCRLCHLVNLDNIGIAPNLMHLLAGRGYNWRVEYDKDKKPHLKAAAKSDNSVLFEVFAEISKPEAIAAAKEARDKKRNDRRAKAEAKRKGKDGKDKK